MVTAVAAHARKFGKQIGAPEVKAAVSCAVGAGDGAVGLVARRNVVPPAAAAIVRPCGKGGQFLDLAVFHLGTGQLARKFAPRSQQAALEHFPFVVDFFHKGADAPLMLAVEIVFKAHPRLGNPIPCGNGHLGKERTPVAGCLTRKPQKLLLAAFTQSVLGRRGQAPAGVHFVQIGIGLAHAGQGQTLEAGHGARGDYHLVGGAQHFLSQAAEKVEVPGARTQGRFLHHAVNVAELQVVLRRHLEVLGAAFDEFGCGALASLDAAFNGGCTLGRNNRIVAVREHQALVGQANGFRTARAAFGNNGNNGHAQASHAVDVAGDLLCRAGVILDGKRAGREDIGVDRYPFRLGHAHVLLRLGVAPGLDRAAVAEFRAVAFFLPYDHHRLCVHLLATAAGNNRTGNKHAGVKAVFVLPAHFGKVVVDVFENIAQADTL